MDFFENVKNVVESTAEVVAKKSGELFETSKIRYSVYDLNAEIKKLFNTLGELVYTNYKSGEDAEERISELCGQIDAKYKEIAALKEQLSEIKNEVTCPVCGQSCRYDTNYCPNCGSELAVPVSGEVRTSADAAEMSEQPEETNSKTEE